MNENVNTKNDNLFAAIAVAVLLLGTATGNAIVMLALSVAVLLVGLLVCKPWMRAGTLRVVLVAAIIGIVSAAGLAFVLR